MIDINKLAALCVLKLYYADDIFFHQNDLEQVFYIILKGKAGVYLTSVDGNELKISEMGPGDHFGEMALLGNHPRTATVKALTDVTVAVVNKDNFDNIIVSEPVLALRIMKVMSDRICHLSDEIIKLKQQLQDQASGHLLASTNIIDYSAGQLASKTNAAPVSLSQTQAPGTHNNYLFDKEIVCPVCNKKFTVKMIRSSKLVVKSIACDLRELYEDFEPLWYKIWVCSHCYYAQFENDFMQVSVGKRVEVNEKLKNLQPEAKMVFSDPRTLEEVIKGYYLALHFMSTGKANIAQIARAWLCLSWLYQDGENEEMADLALEKALEAYTNIYLNTMLTLSGLQELRLLILLGELNLKQGNKQAAYEFFQKAAQHRGNKRLVGQAEDRVSQIKSTFR